MLSIQDLGMRFGGKELFTQASLQLQEGNRYGLVGANGAGKSTFLKLLQGEMEADAGSIAMPSGALVGSLRQDHFRFDQQTLTEVVLQGRPRLWNAFKEKHALLQKTCLNHEESERLGHLESIIDHENGYAAEAEAGALLEGLGLPTASHSQLMSTLSGGYKLRVLLAQLFFSNPDILLLDEPTNHLDIFSIVWLGNYLKQYAGLLIVSSHHRDFLNTVCTHILDIDFGTLQAYKGNYDQFEHAKQLDLQTKEAQRSNQEKKRQDLQGFVDRFRAKSSKARQAQSKAKMIERLEKDMTRLNLQSTGRKSPHLDFVVKKASGQRILKVNRLSKAFGKKVVLDNLNFEIERGAKLAIIGPNGIGKSTILEIVTEHLRADQGEFHWGHGCSIGYFPQNHRREVQGDITLLDWLQLANPLAKAEELRRVLGKVLFTKDEVLQKVETLSGGETARLIMAKLMVIQPNVLLFDEPTNHLDMEAIENFITALNHYKGTLLFVSHNTYFLSHVATAILEISHEGVHYFPMTYAEYNEKKQLDQDTHLADHLRRLATPTPSGKTEDPQESYEERKKRRRAQEQLQRQITQLEERSEDLEEKIRCIDSKMAEPSFYSDCPLNEQLDWVQKKERLEAELEAVLASWEELAEQLD